MHCLTVPGGHSVPQPPTGFPPRLRLHRLPPLHSPPLLVSGLADLLQVTATDSHHAALGITFVAVMLAVGPGLLTLWASEQALFRGILRLALEVVTRTSHVRSDYCSGIANFCSSWVVCLVASYRESST